MERNTVALTYDDVHRLIAVADGRGNRINQTLDVVGNRSENI